MLKKQPKIGLALGSGAARAAEDPADLTQVPQPGNISLYDFHRAKESIKEGELSVLREKTNILQLVSLD